jgi:hypothetical protein
MHCTFITLCCMLESSSYWIFFFFFFFNNKDRSKGYIYTLSSQYSEIFVGYWRLEFDFTIHCVDLERTKNPEPPIARKLES